MIPATDALARLTALGLVRLARERLTAGRLAARDADALLAEIDALRRLALARRDDATQAERERWGRRVAEGAERLYTKRER